MLNKWAKKLINYSLLRLGSASSYTSSPSMCKIKVRNGNYVYALLHGSLTYPRDQLSGLPSGTLNSNIYQGANKIIIGSGTTPPTEEDYNLEHQITSGITFGTTAERIEEDEQGKLLFKYTFTATNTSNSDITISELGYLRDVSASSRKEVHNSSYTSFAILVDRTLLDNPVTIPPEETATITYVIKSDMVITED